MANTLRCNGRKPEPTTQLPFIGQLNKEFNDRLHTLFTPTEGSLYACFVIYYFVIIAVVTNYILFSKLVNKHK